MAIQCGRLHVAVDKAMQFTIVPWHLSTWNVFLITLMTVVLLSVVQSEARLPLAIPPSR